jgi:hypothetical protein
MKYYKQDRITKWLIDDALMALEVPPYLLSLKQMKWLFLTGLAHQMVSGRNVSYWDLSQDSLNIFIMRIWLTGNQT